MLVGYVTGDPLPDAVAIKEELRKWLPVYMIPSYIVRVPEMPLSGNGKIDKRRLLLDYKVDTETMRANYVAPGSKLEKQLAEIWEEVLMSSPIGVEDNFFEAGGHSLKAMQIISRVKKNLGFDVSLRSLFSNACIRKLAADIEMEATRIENNMESFIL